MNESISLPVQPFLVEGRPGYNSWPMIGTMGKRLVCAYSKGTAHSIGETVRGVYAKYSDDGGQSWSGESLVSNQPGFGEVTIGKGNDAQGALLLWVRCVGAPWHHDLYRTEDGITFQRLASPELAPMPMQITDILPLPGHSLMALWFAGDYREEAPCSWGTITSKDDGRSWSQHIVEDSLPKSEWPTELSAVHLGNGRLLAIARTEKTADGILRTQFQLQSEDYGVSWYRTRTNIGDVAESTPSLLYNPDTGRLSNYYYQRGRGFLKRRSAPLAQVWDNPTAWPEPVIVAIGSDCTYHAGNVNAVASGKRHFLAFYSGNETDTSVLVAATDAP